MDHSNRQPTDDPNGSQEEITTSREEPSIDLSVPPTPPLFTSTIPLTTTSPSSFPQPNTPLPPYPPPRGPNRTIIPDFSTYRSLLPNPSPLHPYLHTAPAPLQVQRPLTLNLREPQIPGTVQGAVSEIDPTPASTPSPSTLTCQIGLRDQEDGSLGIPSPNTRAGGGGGEKTIPPHLRAAYKKYPVKRVGGGDLGAQDGDDGVGVLMPLRIGRKRGGGGEGVGGEEGRGARGSEGQGGGESPVMGQTMMDIDALLGLSPQDGEVEDYIGKQKPVFVGMASFPVPVLVSGAGAGAKSGGGAGLSGGGNEDGDSDGKDDTTSVVESDDEDHNVSATSGTGSEVVKTKKKRRRGTRRSGKKVNKRTDTALGDTTPAVPSAPGRGGFGPSTTSPKPKCKSPFLPAVPAEQRLPLTKPENSAPTMRSHPEGLNVPSRQYDSNRLEEIPISEPVRSFREFARQPENAANTSIQHALRAVEAALAHIIEPTLLSAQENLQLRNQVQATQHAANATLAELKRTKRDLDAAAELQTTRQDEVNASVRTLEEQLDEARQKRGKEEEGYIVDDLTRKLAEAEAELDVLTKERDEGGLMSIAQCEAEKARIEKEVEDLAAVVERYNDRDLITHEDCAELTEEKDNAHAQRVEDLEADVKKAKSARDVLQAKLDAAGAARRISETAAGEESAEKINELEGKIKDLERKLAENEDVSVGFISEDDCNESNKEQVEKLERENKDMKAKIRELITNRAPPTNSISLEECAQQNAAASSKLEEEITKLEKLDEELTAATKAGSTSGIGGGASDSALQNKIERLQEEIEEARRQANVATESTAFIASLQTKGSQENATLSKRIAELEGELKAKSTEPTAKDKDGISIQDCEKQKLALNKKLGVVKLQIASLEAKLKAYEDDNTITRKECDEGKAQVMSQIETYKQMVQEAEDYAKHPKERAVQLERENKMLRDDLATVRSELRDCRDGKNIGEKDDDLLDERIDGLDKQAADLNAAVKSQGDALHRRGISIDFQQLQISQQHNEQLTEQNAKLIEEVKRLKSRKVASGYMSSDEKDDKITELIKMINGVNAQTRLYYLKAEVITNKYNQLVVDKANDVKRRVAIKLKEKAREQREKGKSKKTTKKKEDRVKTKLSKDAAKALAAAGEGKATMNDTKQIEIEAIGQLDWDAEVISQTGIDNERSRSEMFRYQLLQFMIKLVEKRLTDMVAARAMNGKREGDSVAAIQAAAAAIQKAEEVKDGDLTAQAFLWAAIAYFYHDENKQSQAYLDQARRDTIGPPDFPGELEAIDGDHRGAQTRVPRVPPGEGLKLGESTIALDSMKKEKP
ncbi:hypothetical protein IFR05_003213 [Cadophora sp. M221]|nr:hypothetical protein IFR05_003213 [Cadophora sp. M221]